MVKALVTDGSEPLLAIPSEVLLPDIGFQKKISSLSSREVGSSKKSDRPEH